MSQSGFKNWRITDHILHLHDTVQKSFANRHHVLAIFINLEKAYDMVSHQVLLFKLVQMGFNGRIFNFMNSFLSRRTFQVRLGSSLSTTKTLETGMPHGSVLSPILFTIAINDLPKSISSPSALYADDCCFWESGSNTEQLIIFANLLWIK